MVTHIRHRLATSLVAAGLLLAACEESQKGKVNAPIPVLPTSVEDSLVFTRSGTSTAVEMGATPLVCCGLYDPSFVNERAMRVVLYDPANQKSGWEILILTDRASAGATTPLPTAVVAPSKVAVVSMFVADSGNELSSDTDESTGSITVHSFACNGSNIQVDFSVDAVLGSEFAGGSSMAVKGTFRATFPAASCPD